MEKQHLKIAVIGAGPGGYVAAIKAAQEGHAVYLIEKGHMGGVCLNVGCIPTKTLLAGASMMHEISKAAEFGITVGPVSVNYAKMHARKEAIIEKMRKNLGGLILSNGITVLQGHAEFISPSQLKIMGKDAQELSVDRVIIATGSEPLDIPAFPCDHQKIVNSTSILTQTVLPKTLVIVGGGYIGCEFAALYAALGVKVTILEALPSIVMAQGQAISEALTRAFVKQGMDIRTGVRVEGIVHANGALTVQIKDQPPISCEMALIAVGRKVISQELCLSKAGVRVDEKGVILVNEKMETNVPGIYAIGDVTGKFLLAHVASHQGIVAALNASGKVAQMHYESVPAVIFTTPEIATVGMTLEQALESGREAGIGKYPFQALGKSIATAHTEGFAQIVIDKKTGQILGAQVIGHDAATLIAEIGLAIANELTIECVIDTIHAHPTVAEVWMEAALISTDTPLHFPPKISKRAP